MQEVLFGQAARAARVRKIHLALFFFCWAFYLGPFLRRWLMGTMLLPGCIFLLPVKQKTQVRWKFEEVRRAGLHTNLIKQFPNILGIDKGKTDGFGHKFPLFIPHERQAYRMTELPESVRWMLRNDCIPNGHNQFLNYEDIKTKQLNLKNFINLNHLDRNPERQKI